MGGFLVLFKSGGHRVSPRFHFLVFDVDQQWQEGKGWVQDYLGDQRDGKTLFRSNASC